MNQHIHHLDSKTACSDPLFLFWRTLAHRLFLEQK